MELSEIQSKTLDTYERIAKDWSSLREKDFWQEELQQFHTLLPHGKILEVGSGSGRDAKYFLSLGYEYRGYDNSPSFVQIASENNPTGLFQLWSLTEPDFTSEYDFDGFWWCAVFVHIPKKEMNYVLSNCISHLKKGAIWFISMQYWKGEGVANRVLPTGESYDRFFSYYSEMEYAHVLESQGLTILKISRNQFEPEKWMGFFFRK